LGCKLLLFVVIVTIEAAINDYNATVYNPFM